MRHASDAHMPPRFALFRCRFFRDAICSAIFAIFATMFRFLRRLMLDCAVSRVSTALHDRIFFLFHYIIIFTCMSPAYINTATPGIITTEQRRLAMAHADILRFYRLLFRHDGLIDISCRHGTLLANNDQKNNAPQQR